MIEIWGGAWEASRYLKLDEYELAWLLEIRNVLDSKSIFIGVVGGEREGLLSSKYENLFGRKIGTIKIFWRGSINKSWNSSFSPHFIYLESWE